ncbi:MAG: DUF4838 domain-containing protein [Kiritimatiellia bacterium]
MKFVSAVWMALVAASVAFGFEIVSPDGEPSAVVVVDENAPNSAALVAQSFVKYVKEMTGARLRVVDEPDEGNVIRIGRPGVASTNLDAIAVFVNPKHELEITGNGWRAINYAAYKFLENAFGVRYWSPWREHVPKHKGLAIPDTYTLRYAPPFEVRAGWSVSDCTPRGKEWAKRVGHNGPLGYPVGIGETMMNLFLNPRKYFVHHQEWYAQVKDYRKGSQICPSNSEALEKLVEEVRDYLQKHPETLVLSLASQDNCEFCTCPDCKKIAKKGGNAALEIYVANHVARTLAKEFPTVKFSVLAYWTKEVYPKQMPLEPNVCVGLALGYNRAYPVSADRAFCANAAAWAQACGGMIYIWDYYANFRNFNEPRPDFINMGANMRYYRDHGYRGVSAQMRLGRLSYFSELVAYLWAQLAWNPDQDEEGIIKEYFRLNYGAGAKDVEAYWNLQLRAMRGAKHVGMGMYGSNYDEWYRAKEMFEAWDLLNHALEVTKDSPLDNRQVEFLYCAALNDLCWRWDRQKLDQHIQTAELKYPIPAPWDMAEELNDIARKYKEGYWSEHKGWDEMVKVFREMHAARKEKFEKDPEGSIYKGKNFRPYLKRPYKVYQSLVR